MTGEKRPVQQGFYSVGGRLLYAERWGSMRSAGGLTLVYENGSTVPGTKDPGWWPIRDTVAAGLPVFLYDRAGLGQSDPAPLPRPLSAFAADLRAVLRDSGTQPPYILVGGSFGGMLVLNYASLYPDEVAGVLLVDSTHPEHNRRTLALLPPEIPGEPAALNDFRSLLKQIDNLPPESNDWEGLDVPTSIAEARAVWNLRDVPLIVLTAGQDEWEEGFPEDAANRYGLLWLELQREMAGLSTNSQHRIIEDSDHLIHARRPDAVIAAIRELTSGAVK